MWLRSSSKSSFHISKISPVEVRRSPPPLWAVLAEHSFPLLGHWMACQSFLRLTDSSSTVASPNSSRTKCFAFRTAQGVPGSNMDHKNSFFSLTASLSLLLSLSTTGFGVCHPNWHQRPCVHSSELTLMCQFRTESGTRDLSLTWRCREMALSFTGVNSNTWRLCWGAIRKLRPAYCHLPWPTPE